ncbi:hypothetical protein P280DRAFT_496496 [Massarina eburnea CBS 473.64]|uniref:Nephrocystin 3-like N-terminal domain-containing protein n=1 Tax=Massarina eburnea CBS 473.64 TaxID=1395130 RepID=A0A6A6SB25_9PLEO|nr:hypothetical protein P280DRAFT_496496 [Massarina eburnea CBS 473.64]
MMLLEHPKVDLTLGDTDVLDIAREYGYDAIHSMIVAEHDYTGGWICALATEYLAAQELLDEEYNRPDSIAPRKNNDYTLGRIGDHNVVVAVLPEGEYGVASAGTVVRDLLSSFLNVRIGMMVGIGGGAPSKKNDIRLGDFVVGLPGNGKGGILHYDFGVSLQEQKFRNTGFLDQTPIILRTVVTGIKPQYTRKGADLHQKVEEVLRKTPRLREDFGRPDQTSDRLFRSDFVHLEDKDVTCESVCLRQPLDLLVRHDRTAFEDNPKVHYGLIAWANNFMNYFPCLLVRGICDYSDTLTAAAYAKDVICRLLIGKVQAEAKAVNVLQKDLREVLNAGQNTNTTCKKLQQWKEKRGSFMWLSGLSGCGKSVLSATIIEKLGEGLTCSPLLCFDFDFNDDRKQSLNDLLHIGVYVKERLRSDDSFRRWKKRPEILDEIQDALTKKVDCMFRWAACQIDILKDCPDPLSLGRALASLLKDFYSMYNRIINEIPEHIRPNAIKMLQFMTYSKRSWTRPELVDIVATDVDTDPSFPPSYRMPDPTEITRYCPSLVKTIILRYSIVHNGRQIPNVLNVPNEHTRPQLAHASVKEYLTSDQLDARLRASFSKVNAYASISTTCINYLISIADLEIRTVNLRLYPLAYYSATQWWRHAHLAEEHNPKLQALIQHFVLDCKDARAFTCCIYYPSSSRFSWSSPQQPGHHARIDKTRHLELLGIEKVDTPLHFASFAGLSKTISYLLSEKHDINLQRGLFNTALQAAAFQGHAACVNFLIDRGADVNIFGEEYYNALEAAVAGGHTHVIQLLLSANARMHTERFALKVALLNGYMDIVQLILDNDASIENPMSPVLDWSFYPRDLQLLLSNGAGVNGSGKKHGITAL